jgi:hypothetical protein
MTSSELKVLAESYRISYCIHIIRKEEDLYRNPGSSVSVSSRTSLYPPEFLGGLKILNLTLNLNPARMIKKQVTSKKNISQSTTKGGNNMISPASCFLSSL